MKKKTDTRSLDRGVLEDHRRLAVRRVLAGESQRAVARFLGVHFNSVCAWMKAYRLHGEAGLERRKAPGRAATLRPRQQDWVKRTVVGKEPRQLKFPFALWSIAGVRALIEKKYDLLLHKTTVARMLHKWGLTPQRPVRQAVLRDSEECRRWMEADFPKIVRQTKRRQATLMFGDEAAVHEDGPVAHTWAPKGCRPVVKVTGRRGRINVISFITPRGRLWFRCFGGTLTGALLVTFLEALLHDVRGKIVLVLDRHPAHTSAVVLRFLRKHAHRLTVHFLPRYAPDLNPDEHVWSYLKGRFRSEPVSMDERLAVAVHEEMVDIQLDKALVRSFFGHPQVAYVKKALHW